MGSYEEAVRQLYQAPLAEFVAQRKRLATELRAQGDTTAASELGALRRPTTSAWTVNQLYCHARDAFDAMLDAAARVRKGDLGATPEYRETIVALRKRAAGILTGAGLRATDALLHRVATTLGALAAGGGFDPDPPGALATDRDPPGFEAIDPQAPLERPAPKSHAELRPAAARDGAAAERRQAKAAAAAERAERKRAAAERARHKAERSRLHAKLRTATTEARSRERTLAALQREIAAAEKAAAESREVVRRLERLLGELDDAE